MMEQHIENCSSTLTSPLQGNGMGVRRKCSFKVEDLIAENNETFQQRECSVMAHECSTATLQSRLDDVDDHIESATSQGKDSKGHEGREMNRRKKSRSSFSVEQLCELEKRFSTQRYLGTKERADFAQKIKLSDTQVKTWFQNRRMKLKRQKVEAANRLAKFAMFKGLSYSAGAHVHQSFPAIQFNAGPSQNFAPPVPLALPRVLVDDLYYRDGDQARTSLPVMFSPYSLSGQTDMLHASTALTSYHHI